jgi:hypothetical protein
MLFLSSRKLQLSAITLSENISLNNGDENNIIWFNRKAKGDKNERQKTAGPLIERPTILFAIDMMCF